MEQEKSLPRMDMNVPDIASYTTTYRKFRQLLSPNWDSFIRKIFDNDQAFSNKPEFLGRLITRNCGARVVLLIVWVRNWWLRMDIHQR